MTRSLLASAAAAAILIAGPGFAQMEAENPGRTPADIVTGEETLVPDVEVETVDREAASPEEMPPASPDTDQAAGGSRPSGDSPNDGGLATGLPVREGYAEPALPATGGAAGEGVSNEAVETAGGPIDLGGVPAADLIGAEIQTENGERVASVEDVIATPEGAVEQVAARFGGFLGFGTEVVLLDSDEIAVIADPSGELVVQTALSPEEIEAKEPYTGG